MKGFVVAILVGISINNGCVNAFFRKAESVASKAAHQTEAEVKRVVPKIEKTVSKAAHQTEAEASRFGHRVEAEVRRGRDNLRDWYERKGKPVLYRIRSSLRSPTSADVREMEINGDVRSQLLTCSSDDLRNIVSTYNSDPEQANVEVELLEAIRDVLRRHSQQTDDQIPTDPEPNGQPREDQSLLIPESGEQHVEGEGD